VFFCFAKIAKGRRMEGEELLAATPVAASLGGLLGVWFAWKCPNHQPF
jgi:hypothetical protein